MAIPVMWFEDMGRDSVGLQRFYSEVFGWKLTPPMKDMGNYSMFADRPKTGIAGGIGEDHQARVSIYMETSDPQGLLDKAARAGATVIMPVTTITPTTTIAMMRDPAGNTIGLMKSSTAPRKAASKTTRARKKTTAKRKGTRKTTRRRRR